MNIRNLGLLSLALFIAPSSYGVDIDLNYIKESDPSLYEKILVLQDCQKNKTPALQCGKQTQTSAPAAAAPPPASTKWWLSSAFSGTTPQKHWQHAVNATVALQKMSGTTEGKPYSGKVDYYSRYDQLTNELSFASSKNDLKQAGEGELDRKTRSFSFYNRYDVNEDWFGQVGYNDDKDTGLLMERNRTAYVGAGLHFIDSSNFVLSGLVSLGRSKENTSHTGDEATGLNHVKFDVAHIVQNAHWVITDKLSLTQTLDVTTSLEKIDEFGLIGGNKECIDTLSSSASYCVIGKEHNNIVKLSLELDYKITDYLSVGYSVDIKDNSNPFLTDESKESIHNFNLQIDFQ